MAKITKMLFVSHIIHFYDFWTNAGYDLQFFYIKPEHNIIEITIDDVVYDIDATMGVFKNSDLSQSKFSGHKISGWKVYVGTNNNIQRLEEGIKKVQSDSKGLQDAVFDYVQSKAESEGYIHWSIDMRVNMFMKLVAEYGHTGEIQVLSYAHKLKQLFFTEQECSEIYKNKTKVAVQFIRNTEPPCVSMLVFYNVEGEVKAYELDLTKEVEIHRTTVEQIKQDAESGKLKYVTASKTIDNMVEDVIKTAQSFNKVKSL